MQVKHAKGRLAIHIRRDGQNRIYTLYMTVYLVISLLKILYIHRIYMVLANFTHQPSSAGAVDVRISYH
jgi:hypothetical protein